MRTYSIIFILSLLLMPSGHSNELIPKRSVSIIVTDEGFYPENLIVYTNENIEIFVTSTKDMPSCLMQKENNLFISAKKGEVSEGKLFFKKAGTFKINCPSEKFSGKIVVLNKASSKVKRKIASKEAKRPSMWTPKEY